MYIASLIYINEMLAERHAELSEQMDELAECIESYERASKEIQSASMNDEAYREMKAKYSYTKKQCELAKQVLSDFERTNWH